MFQLFSKNEELQDLLKQEVEYFRSILQFSEKSLGQIETLSVNVLSEMLSYRQEWIDKIKKLEEKRKTLQEEHPDVETEGFLRKISQLASSLVEIDNQIYKNLQARKLKYIQQLIIMLIQ